MRTPRHLSPTSFDLWEKDKEQFYLNYLSERRFDRNPQTLPMSIGSAFDYEVKKFLIGALGTKLHSTIPNEELKMQVEPHNLPQAEIYGKAVFQHYSKSGALSALMMEIVSDARFEFAVTGTITNQLGEVVLTGRPDGYYTTKAKADGEPVSVVHDFKVNGWLSSAKSPDKGFIALHEADGRVLPAHKEAYLTYYKGIKINGAEVGDMRTWKKQLAIYGWLLGCPVGQAMIGSIDQVIGPESKPRVAKHRFLIKEEFQINLYKELVECWKVINSGHIFRDLNEKDSAARCAALESQVVDGPEDDSWMKEMGQRER